MSQRLIGKVALVTGGGTWIGKEIAKHFASEGAKVFIIGRKEKNLECTVKEINKNGGIASYYVADISVESQVIEALSAVIAEFKQLDILVQNAGIYPFSPIDEMTLAEWQHVIDVNLTGSFIMLKHSAEIIMKQAGGRVVFISSVAGEEIGYAGLAHYAASKAGMNGLMRSAALEFAPYQMTVNSIEPGNIINDVAFNISAIELDEMQNRIPLGRTGQPIDVAHLALFLASKESSFITGQNFVIDGGQTISIKII